MLFEKKSMVVFLFLGLVAIGFKSKTTAQTKETSGPYIIVLRRCEDCAKVSPPYAKDPPAGLFYETKNNIIKGKLTIFRKNNNMRITTRDYYYEDGKWQLTFHVMRGSCRSRLIAVVLDGMGIKYNKKTCAIPEGTYSYELDFNKVNHVWMPTREYGPMMRRFELLNKNETIACLELEADVKPIK